MRMHNMSCVSVKWSQVERKFLYIVSLVINYKTKDIGSLDSHASLKQHYFYAVLGHKIVAAAIFIFTTY